jgi:hypothetical protein
MPAPKRRAPRRTAAAIAEDLTFARRAGGLRRADAEALSATLDWLAVAGVSPDEEPLSRARDLLLHYIKRVCEAYEDSDEADTMDSIAATSLVRLLLRRPSDDELAQVIRRDVAAAANHRITPDAVRHREDRLIVEIAEHVGQDLGLRRLDVPQTVEAAVHRLAPIVVEVRQQLHDGLCVTYQHVPPADQRERRVIGGFYRQMVIDLGQLLLAGSQLVEVGLRGPNLSTDELGFVSLARRMMQRLFVEVDDREYMLEFSQSDETEWQEPADLLLTTGRGLELYERWVEWAGSCYPTCAFERSPDVSYMCSPHAFLTLLYDFEAGYVAVGYSAVNLPEHEPLRHHGQDVRP